VIGDILFARWIGIAGIALATAVVQAISLITVVILLLRREWRLIA
jgi:Na+-driven multidrug efflux pump